MPHKAIEFEPPQSWYKKYFKELVDEMRAEKLDDTGKAGSILFQFLADENIVNGAFIPIAYARPIYEEVEKQRKRYRKNELARARRRDKSKG